MEEEGRLFQLVLTIYGLLKLHSVANIIPLISRKVPIEKFTAQKEATKVMQNVRRCVFNSNHLQVIAFLDASVKTVNFKSDKLNDRPGGLTSFRLSCNINIVDINPHICQKTFDLQFYLLFPQHQYNLTTRVINNLISARKRIKIPDRGKGSMAALL